MLTLHFENCATDSTECDSTVSAARVRPVMTPVTARFQKY